MSTQITTAFVQQYSANVLHLSQQKGSRLRGACRNESQKGKAAFWDRIGSVTAQVSSTRHGDTPISDTPHSRRMVTLSTYKHADLFDSADKVRTLIDPTSEYLKSFMYAFGRAMDDVIIAAALGTAYTGETGSDATVLPTTQKIVPVSGGFGANMNVGALRTAKMILDQSDVDPSIPRYCALNASMLNAMLGQTEVTSSDFNSVKALVQGELNTFLGFNIIRTERLLAQSGALLFNSTSGLYEASTGTVDANGYERAVCWAQDGLLFSVGQDFKGRISERDDKCYSMQAYAEMDVGAVRMEEEKVVEILCDT